MPEPCLTAEWPPGWTAGGVIARLEPLIESDRRVRLRQALDQRLDSVTIVLDRPAHAHNVSAVMRSCDAFGVDTLHVVSADEGGEGSRKVSQGTERWVEQVHHLTSDAAVAWLRRGGFSLIATSPEGILTPEEVLRIPRPALLLGNEHFGLCPELEQAADSSVRIPMRGFVTSLNMSVAAALLLRAATEGRPGDLSEEQRDQVYARGLYRSVSRAPEILAASQAR